MGPSAKTPWEGMNAYDENSVKINSIHTLYTLENAESHGGD